jgi:hypothetical protein
MVTVNLGDIHAPRRAARKRSRRPSTVSMRRLVRERGALTVLNDDDDDFADVSELTAPATRSACRKGPRPCPWVSCRFHLYLDVNPRSGSIKINFPDREVWELDVSCALDVAEARGGMSLDELGRVLNLTRERARQLEHAALHKIGDVVGSDER